jgi:hypothetical protein
MAGGANSRVHAHRHAHPHRTVHSTCITHHTQSRVHARAHVHVFGSILVRLIARRDDRLTRPCPSHPRGINTVGLKAGTLAHWDATLGSPGEGPPNPACSDNPGSPREGPPSPQLPAGGLTLTTASCAAWSSAREAVLRGQFLHRQHDVLLLQEHRLREEARITEARRFLARQGRCSIFTPAGTGARGGPSGGTATAWPLRLRVATLPALHDRATFARLEDPNLPPLAIASFYGDAGSEGRAFRAVEDLIGNLQPHAPQGIVAGDFIIPAGQMQAWLSIRHPTWRIYSPGPTRFTPTAQPNALDHFLATRNCLTRAHSVAARLTGLATHRAVDLTVGTPALSQAPIWKRPPRPLSLRAFGPVASHSWDPLHKALRLWKQQRHIHASGLHSCDIPHHAVAALTQLWRQWGHLASVELRDGEGPSPVAIEAAAADRSPPPPALHASSQLLCPPNGVCDAHRKPLITLGNPYGAQANTGRHWLATDLCHRGQRHGYPSRKPPLLILPGTNPR